MILSLSTPLGRLERDKHVRVWAKTTLASFRSLSLSNRIQHFLFTLAWRYIWLLRSWQRRSRETRGSKGVCISFNTSQAKWQNRDPGTVWLCVDTKGGEEIGAAYIRATIRETDRERETQDWQLHSCTHGIIIWNWASLLSLSLRLFFGLP